MRNKCLKCGNSCMNEYCWKCKPKRPLKKSVLRRTSSNISKKSSIVEKYPQMKEFFLEIWKERPHYSEISGQSLGNEPKSFYFHHVILKSDSKYGKKGIYDKENIILLSAEEHSTVHLDMYKYEEINKRREYLLEKYEKI